jgi:hypothetical protein
VRSVVRCVKGMEIQLAVGRGQQAELKKESGVRIQEEKKHKKCPFLLATDYLGFYDLKDLDNGLRTTDNGRRAMRSAPSDFADAAWPDT